MRIPLSVSSLQSVSRPGFKPTLAEVLVELELHAGDATGMGTWRSRLISAP